jgi:hypothetical protein
MSTVRFSLLDYQDGLARGFYVPPAALCPYYEVDPVRYRLNGTTDLRRGNLRRALGELRQRTERSYFSKTYPLQARTLIYSARAFPAYRFILPEVMTEDWLAVVDWGKFQRDHVLHQPLCGYVVLKLLNGNGTEGPFRLPNGTTLLEACVESILRWNETAYIRDFLIHCGMNADNPILKSDSPIAREVWRVFFLEAAYVAAVFHDIGYPWQYAERIQCNLDGMNAPAIRHNRSAAQIVDVFGHRLLFRVLQGYRVPDAACPSSWHEKISQLTDAALTLTHGLPGALGFLHLNDCVRRYPTGRESPLHLLCIEWAAAAIMMHDMSKIYWGAARSHSGVPENPFLRLDFGRDPLAALVTLVDLLQDFERPAATFGRCGCQERQPVTLMYDTGCSETEMTLDADVLTVNYKMNDEQSRAAKRRSLDKERHECFDSQYGYLNVGSLGIREVRSLAG